LFPVCELMHSVHDPDSEFFPAYRADVVVLCAFLWREKDSAFPMAVIVILAFFGKEFDRIQEFIRVFGLYGIDETGVAEIRIEDVGFPPDLGR